MAVTLVIKDVDESVVERLRQRAVRNRRSLQDELLAIIEEQALLTPCLTPADVLREVWQQGLKTPREGARMIRADRDRAGRDHELALDPIVDELALVRGE